MKIKYDFYVPFKFIVSVSEKKAGNSKFLLLITINSIKKTYNPIEVRSLVSIEIAFSDQTLLQFKTQRKSRKKKLMK